MRKYRRQILALTLMAALLMTFAPLSWAEDGGKVNINKATVEELMQLDRIGPSYAERIVQYRKDHGPFEKPEDITQVRGVGLKTWEANKDRITVD
mgnify:CR=1 FL=1